MGIDVLHYVKSLSPAYRLFSSGADILSPPKPDRAPAGPLEPGDILIKMNDVTALNVVITYGQIYTGGDHAAFTHAGLASSSTMIAEMSGDGLEEHSLVGKNAGYSYSVFRCNYRQVAIAAGEANSKLLECGKKVVYSKSGAVSSLLPSYTSSSNHNRLKNALAEMASGKTFGLFCSEHVVFCYLVALEEERNLPLVSQGAEFKHLKMGDFFDKEPWQYSPGYLYGMLLTNKLFTYMGRWRGMKWTS